MVRSVVRARADVMALQEVDRFCVRSAFSDQPRAVAAATGLHATFVRTRRLLATGQYGIALLTPTAPTAVEVLELPNFGGERRVALLASVELRGRAVTVAATHLQNRPDVAVRQLEVVLDRLTARPGPRVLLGDLNVGRGRVGQRIEEAGLVPARGGPTFPTHAPTETIDWIAADGLELGPPEVLDVWLSDHFPMAVTLRAIEPRTVA